MNPPTGAPSPHEALQQTQLAFDSVAADYDGPRGNNALIQRMRETVWRVIDRSVAPDANLIDLGCGTGIDAVHFAQGGRRVTATDWSPQMVARTRARALEAGVAARLDARQVGAHELEKLEGVFDGAYSNLGPLNCVPDLPHTAAQCARLVKPGGSLVFSVIGRYCPWEYVYYRWQGRHERARVRSAVGQVAVSMNRQTIWTSYYTPREFHAAFAPWFSLARYQGLSLFLPPPYLVSWYEKHPRLLGMLGRIDDAIAGWPGLRNAGDHFLIVMNRRSS